LCRKAFMGHADISTTTIYVHHVPQHDAAEKLSAAPSASSVESVAPEVKSAAPIDSRSPSYYGGADDCTVCPLTDAVQVGRGPARRPASGRTQASLDARGSTA
jgi:hypothetical protein